MDIIDRSGISQNILTLSGAALFVVSKMDGAHSWSDIQAAFMLRHNRMLFSSDLDGLIDQLDCNPSGRTNSVVKLLVLIPGTPDYECTPPGPDESAVLELHILRRRGIFENQKPWNRGKLLARGKSKRYCEGNSVDGAFRRDRLRLASMAFRAAISPIESRYAYQQQFMRHRFGSGERVLDIGSGGIHFLKQQFWQTAIWSRQVIEAQGLSLKENRL
jgi:hypothetical protein